MIVNINRNTEIMKKSTNSDRPAKGSIITVSPIRKLKDIRSIQKMLAENTRNLLLFTMGINNGLRTGDLLKLKVGDLKNLKIGNVLEIREGKTFWEAPISQTVPYPHLKQGRMPEANATLPKKEAR